MTQAQKVRIWNARRGVARAASQIAENMNEAFDADEPLADSVLAIGLENFTAAIEELRAAESLIVELVSA